MFHEMSRVTAINNQIQENSQPYLSCVDFCGVRPAGRTLFLCLTSNHRIALTSKDSSV